MDRKERLTRTLNGESVDRPAVNFYEIGGVIVDCEDQDEFNIYNSKSWKPLIELAEAETDIIRMCSANLNPTLNNPRSEYFTVEEFASNSSKSTKTTLKISGRMMTSLTKIDKDIDTIWTIEYLLKNLDDLKAYLSLPDEIFDYDPDVSGLIEEEKKIGNAGIVMVETPDPLCYAATLFSMADLTVIAMTEKKLFHELLNKLATPLYKRVERIAKTFPGHLWRIYGPEYATPPYLPPNLFEEYVVNYDSQIIELIHKYDGYARIHCHGKIRSVLPYIVDMGADAIDPIEPPHQGDAELSYVRKEYGQDLVLFGNLEVTDIENMETDKFKDVVKKTIKDGTSGTGRGFVLMPSSCPFGRHISERTVANYRVMMDSIM